MLSVFVLNRLIYLWDVFSGGSDSSAGYLKPRNDRTETSLRSFLRTLYVVFLPRVGSSGGWVKCCCVCVWVGRLSLTLRCVRCYVRGFVSIDPGRQQRLMVWLVSMTTRHFDEFWFGSLCQIFEWSQLPRSLCSGCTKRRIVRFFLFRSWIEGIRVVSGRTISVAHDRGKEEQTPLLGERWGNLSWVVTRTLESPRAPRLVRDRLVYLHVYIYSPAERLGLDAVQWLIYTPWRFCGIFLFN